MLIGLQLRDLSNYFNIIEYGFLIKRVSQYYKYCTMLLIRITIQNSQIKKLNYLLIIKDPSIYIP